MTLPQQVTQHNNGEWVFDTGASSHMRFGSGISFSSPPSSPSHIIVGDGSALPITSHASVSLPNPTHTLYLHKVLISPKIIKNLVSIRSFTRDNFISIEFDPFGISIKDLTSGTVLHRCDSSGDLYPFVPLRPASTPPFPPRCGTNVLDTPALRLSRRLLNILILHVIKVWLLIVRLDD
jgi:hypothetical protein